MSRIYTQAMVAFVAFGALWVVSSATPEEPKPRWGDDCRIEALFAEEPPAIDGKLDDACWKDADLATGFSVISGERLARAQTEVRVLYDIRHLYVGVTAFDDDIDKAIFAKPAPGVHDTPGIFDKDEVEVFLDPPGESYYQFCGTAAGAQSDLASKLHLRWDAEWELAATIDKDRYFVEMAIPFAELRYGEGFAGTPAPGDEWRVNFCRVKSHQGEYTCWSYTLRGFHRPERFGHLTFGPYPKGWVPLLVKVPQRWGLGPNEVALQPLSDVSEPIVATAQIRYSGGATQTLSATIGKGPAGRTVVVDANVDSPGQSRLTIEARQVGRHLYFGEAQLDIFDIAGTLRQLAASSAVVAEEIRTISKTPDALESALLSQTSDASTQIRALLSEVETTEQVTGGGWDAWRSRAAALRETLANVEFDAARLCARRFWADPKTGQAPAAAIGLQDGMHKVFGDEPFSGLLQNEILIEAASNERESFQVVVMPVGESLPGVYLVTGDLVGPEGRRIPRGNLEWHVVRTVDIQDPPFPVRRTGLHPDPLEPGRPYDVPLDRNQVFWVTVAVPPGTPAGDYKGKVRVVVPGVRTFPITVNLKVWDFELPPKNHLKLDFWYSDWNVFHCWWHGQYPTPEEFDSILQLLEKYRLATYTVPGITFCPVDIWKEPDGTFTFNYDTLDRYLEVAFRHGLNAFNLNFSCNLIGIMSALKPDYCNVHDRKTGRRTNGKYGPDTLTREEADRVFRELLPDYIAHLKEKGWWDAAHIECIDEPGPDLYDELKRVYGLLHEVAPDLKRLSAGVRVGHPLGDYVEIYCPQTQHFDLEPALEAQRKGKHSWWYICWGPNPPWPNWFVTQDCVAHRVLFWQSWQNRIEGFLYWSVNYWWRGKAEDCPKDPALRWPSKPFELTLFGDGVLIYPGYRLGEPWPSLRLNVIRDGLEDYEYLWLLNDLARRAKEVGMAAEIVKEAERILAVPPELTPDLKTYNDDPSVLLNLRRRVAELIVRLRKMLAAGGPSEAQEAS